MGIHQCDVFFCVDGKRWMYKAYTINWHNTARASFFFFVDVRVCLGGGGGGGSRSEEPIRYRASEQWGCHHADQECNMMICFSLLQDLDGNWQGHYVCHPYSQEHETRC